MKRKSRSSLKNFICLVLTLALISVAVPLPVVAGEPEEQADITKYVPGNKAGDYTISLPVLPDGAKYYFTKTDDSGVIDDLPSTTSENVLSFTTNSGKTPGTTDVITVTVQDSPGLSDYSFKVNVTVSEYTVEYAWPEQKNIWLDKDNELVWAEDGVTLDRSKITVIKNGAIVTDYTAKVSSNTLTPGKNTLKLDPGAYRIEITGDNGKLDDWVEFSVVELIENGQDLTLDIPDWTYPDVAHAGGKYDWTAKVGSVTCAGKKIDLSKEDITKGNGIDDGGLKLWYENADRPGGLKSGFLTKELTIEDFSYVGGVRDFITPFGDVVIVGDSFVYLPKYVTVKELLDDDGNPVSVGDTNGKIYYMCSSRPELHVEQVESEAGGQTVTKLVLYNGDTPVPEGYYFRDGDNFYFGNGENAYRSYGGEYGFISFYPVKSYAKGKVYDMGVKPVTKALDKDENGVQRYDENGNPKYVDCSLACGEWEARPDYGSTVYVGKNYFSAGGTFLYTGNITPEVHGSEIWFGDDHISLDMVGSGVAIACLPNDTIDGSLAADVTIKPHAYARYKADDCHYQIDDCGFMIYPNNSLISFERKDEYNAGDDAEIVVELKQTERGMSVFVNDSLYRFEGYGNHTIRLEHLKEGKYHIAAFGDGDDYVTSYSSSDSFTVNRTDPVLTLTGKTPTGEAFAGGDSVQYHPENSIVINAINDKAASDASWEWTVSDPEVAEIVKTERESRQDERCSENIYLKALKTGEVTVTARFSGNYMYYPKKATMSFTVVPMQVTKPIIEVVDEDKLHYDGTEKKPSVKVYYEEGKEIPDTEYDVTYSNNISASGENSKAKVMVKNKADSHYIFDAEKEFVIQESVPTIEILPVASEITYGQTLAKSSLSGGVAKVKHNVISGNYAWKESDIVPEVSDSENTGFDVVFTPDKTISGNENYLPGSCKVKLKVNKVDIPASAITAPTAKTGLTYTGAGLELVNAGSVSGNIGTIYYAVTESSATEAPKFDGTSAAPDKEWSDSVPEAVDAGSYKIWYMAMGDSNHNDTTVAGPVSVDIAKADYTGTKTASGCVRRWEVTTDATLTLPVLPDEASYAATGTVSQDTAALISGTPYVSGNTLTFSTTSRAEKTSATIIIAVKDAKNYKDYEVVVTITAKWEAGVTITGGDRTVTYGTDDFTLEKTVTDAGSGTGIWTFSSSDPSVADIGENTGTVTLKNIGSTSINAVYESESTYGEASITLKVDPKTLDISWSNISFTYDGKSHVPTAELSGVKSGDDCTVSVNGAQTNAGSGYTATSSLAGAAAGRYKLPSDKDTCSFTISKADIRSATITPGASLTYNGSEQTQTVSQVELDGMTIPASDYTVSDNRGTNAGSYTLTVTAKENSNYTGSATKSFTIAKKDITPTVIFSGSNSFTGSAITPDHTVKDGSTTISENQYSVSLSDNVNAGTASITLTPAADGNYSFSPVTKEFTIAKAAAQTLESVSMNRSYGATGIRVSVPEIMPANAGTLSYTAGSVSVLKAGGSGIEVSSFTVSETGMVSASIINGAVGDVITLPVTIASTNYEDSTVDIVITLRAKETQTITVSDVMATYGDTDKSVSAIVTDPANGGGAISYAVKTGSEDYIDVDASTGSLIIKKVPADGKAYVIVTAAENEDFLPASREVTVIINRANAAMATVTANDRTYDGTEKQLVNVTGQATGGTMQYALGTDAATPPADDLYTAYVPAKANAGTYHVWYRVAADTDHNDVSADMISVSIGKKALTVTADATGKEYGEDDPELTYSSEGLAEGDTISGNLVRAEGENVGTYAIEKGTLDAGANYDMSFTPALFTIIKTDADISSPTANNLTYNGQEQELVTAGTVSGGSVLYSLDGSSYDSEIPKAKDAGEYTVYYMVTGDDNHNDTEAEQITVTILKKSLTVTADAKSRKYGESDPELTYTIDGLIEGDGITGALSRAEGESAGTYAISLGTLTAGDNYSIIFTGASLEIVKTDKSALDNAIGEAEVYYDSIKAAEKYKDIAASLKKAIDAAKAVSAKEELTDAEISEAVKAIVSALDKAKKDISEFSDDTEKDKPEERPEETKTEELSEEAKAEERAKINKEKTDEISKLLSKKENGTVYGMYQTDHDTVSCDIVIDKGRIKAITLNKDSIKEGKNYLTFNTGTKIILGEEYTISDNFANPRDYKKARKFVKKKKDSYELELKTLKSAKGKSYELVLVRDKKELIIDVVDVSLNKKGIKTAVLTTAVPVSSVSTNAVSENLIGETGFLTRDNVLTIATSPNVKTGIKGRENRSARFGTGVWNVAGEDVGTGEAHTITKGKVKVYAMAKEDGTLSIAKAEGSGNGSVSISYTLNGEAKRSGTGIKFKARVYKAKVKVL